MGVSSDAESPGGSPGGAAVNHNPEDATSDDQTADTGLDLTTAPDLASLSTSRAPAFSFANLHQVVDAQGLGRRFWTLIGAIFLAFVGIGTVVPGMALHVHNDLGGNDQTVGFVIGTFSVVALGSRFISGPLADRRGRKVSFLTGLVSCALSGLAYLLPLGVASAYLGRGLQGFGEACLYTGAAAWAVETAGVHRSGRALGFVSTGIWGGMSAGPLIGAWLGTFEHAAILQTVMALASIALLSQLPENYTPHESTGPRLFIPGHLLRSGFAVGFVNVHYPVVAGFLLLHLAQHGGSGPAAYSAYAGMVLGTRFFLGGLPDRVPPAYTFYSGLTSMAAGLAIIAFTQGPAMSIVGSALLGLGFSLPWASVASMSLKRVPANRRASSLGVLSAFFDLFVGTSSAVAGTMATHYGYSSTFLLALGGVCCAALAGFRVFFPKVKTGEPEVAVA